MTEWRPDKLARRLPHLQARARLQAAMRQWFAAEGFVEVETPILQVAPGAEVHLTGFATRLGDCPTARSAQRWLHSSPEFAMKKLLAGGVPKLFQFARVFRNAEGSALHHPEFTMLEWYRAGAGYETIMADCAALLALDRRRRAALGRSMACDPAAEPERLTVAEAFERYAGVDLFATIGNAETLSRAVGHRHARRRQLGRRLLPRHVREDRVRGSAWAGRRSSASTRSRWRRWPAPSPAIRGWPNASSSMSAASSSPTPSASSPIPRSSARGSQADMDEKERLYGVRWPVDDDFLAALDHGLPDCSGIALGFDRLVMLATRRLAHRGRAVAAASAEIVRPRRAR